MSAASVQLVRLISFKTAPTKRTSSGASSTSAESSASAARPSLLGGLGGRRRASSAAQERFSTSSSGNRGGDQGTGKNVRIEVFAHGASGEEAVLVASLSNSVLLVLRMGDAGLRSWLMEWPVAGKIRGLCVSPDLQCVLCVTEGLEGVYLLAIDDLGDHDEAKPHPTEAVPGLNDGAAAAGGLHAGGGVGGNGGLSGAAGAGDGDTPDGGKRSGSGSARRSPAAAARHAPKRTVADTAFPSLVHLASRGEQRKRVGGAKARYPPAEPVFIASLARRGAAAESKGQLRQESDDDRGSRRHSTGSGGRGPRLRGGGSRMPVAPFECLWWVTRDGDHFAIIGGPGGEVHFLDLERLGAWVVTPPPPSMARGRVCALSIVADLAGAPQRPSPTGAGSDAAPSLPSGTLDRTTAFAAAAAVDGGSEQSHLVAVLETGAVFVVLLERSSSSSGGGGGGGASNGGEGGPGRSGDGTESEAKDETAKDSKHGGGGGDGNNGGGDSNNGGGEGGQESSSEYLRLGADQENRPEFGPWWLDVGRGGGGGGGGGMGVRAMPPLSPPGMGGDAGAGRLRVSIVSRAWGNKCAVKILRVAGALGAAAAAGGTGDKEKEPQQGWGREWGKIAGGGGGGGGSGGGGRQQALRTETVRQVTLPVDHPVPEQHALAAVDGSYAVLASPPAGGAPARVTVAPLGAAERPAAHPVCVFPLPAGEHVRGVALLPCGIGRSSADGDGKATGCALTPGSSWGLVWSESCVYRVDLGADARAAAAPKAATDTGPAPAAPKARLPSTPSRQSPGKASGSIALRRPPAAAVRRANELHAAGELSEATQVAMEALDGAPSSSSTTPSRGTGGEATTRMVREELANSLLEWLVTLHVQQASASLRLATGVAGGAAGSIDSSSRSNAGTPDSDTVKAKKRSSTGSPAGGSQARPARRGSKLAPPSRLASKSGPKSRESALATPKTPSTAASSPAAAAAAAAAAASCFSRLERYLLSSRDYDPVLAATLLHEHGEAGLAIVAGTARGGKGGAGAAAGGRAVAVLPKVLRVLAEAAWPPRLGTRAVDALCGDETGAAAREAVHASGGTLFAALEPGLQLRVILSHRSVVFGLAEVGEQLAAGEKRRGTAEAGGAESPMETGTAVEAADAAGARALLGPIVPALSSEELSVLVSRLAEWCKEDAAGRHTKGANEDVAAAAAAERAPPSVAALEALEVLLLALCELAGRAPPLGEHHRRAWSLAGCIVDEPASHEGQASGAPPLEWAQLAASLCDFVSGEGAARGSSGDGGDAGGLPTAARRQLLRVLPVVRGWHDPVGVLLRLREAGCWAAVALQLELSGNTREGASATLHGVVAHLQGGERGTQGDIARILSGTAVLTGFGAQKPSGSPPAVATVAETSTKRSAREAILRVISKHALPGSRGEGTPGGNAAADGGETVAPSPAVALPPATSRPATAALTSAVVLERASVLAEALCVWKYFGLPLAALEASLRPHLDEGDGARVLTAVLFPQLSRDTARNGATSDTDPLLAQEGQRRARGLGGGMQTQNRTPRDGAYLHDLGLSPRFFLSLTRVAAKSTGLGSPTAPSSSSRRAPGDRRGAGGPAASSGSSALTLLLEHGAAGDGGSELNSARVQPGAIPPSSSSGVGSRRAAGRVEAGGSWPPGSGFGGAQGYAPSYSSRAAADSCTDTAVWFFSCGHRFSRQHLLDSVVPTSASSVRQATASLERTQRVLALEYGGRGSAAAGAACPECAAKELVRLAAVAGGSVRARRASTSGGNSSPLPPPPPPPPPMSSQRLPTQERPRVR